MEQPIRDSSITGWRQLEVLVALAVVPPSLVGGLVALTAKYVWPMGMSISPGRRSSCSLMLARNTRGRDRSAMPIPRPCAWNQGASGRPVHLVSDSNTGHFAPVLADATAATGHPLKTQTSAGSPVLDPSTQGLEPGVDAACLPWIDRTLL